MSSPPIDPPPPSTTPENPAAPANPTSLLNYDSFPPLPLSGLAVSAFVTSLLGIILFPLALVALALGFLAYPRTTPTKARGRRLAVASLIISTLSLILATVVILYTVRTVNNRVGAIHCASNLRNIGQALNLYCNNNAGQFPPDLQTLLSTTDIDPFAFECVSTPPSNTPSSIPHRGPGSRSFVYLRPSAHPADLHPDTVLIYEHLSNHRFCANILFADGRVEQIPSNLFSKILSDLQSGQNPPPSLNPAPLSASSTQP